MNYAVILAAGRGERLGKNTNKVFEEISPGKSILQLTLEKFLINPEISKIVLVVSKEDKIQSSKLLGSLRNTLKPIVICLGGKTRQISAYKGLCALENQAKEGDLILFHNGANPLVSQNEINKAILAARRYGASVVGFMAVDTVKILDVRGEVKASTERKYTFIAQMPQVIEYTLALKVFSYAEKNNISATDDSSLVELYGHPVKAVLGSPDNFKITFKKDLLLARLLVN